MEVIHRLVEEELPMVEQLQRWRRMDAPSASSGDNGGSTEINGSDSKLPSNIDRQMNDGCKSVQERDEKGILKKSVSLEKNKGFVTSQVTKIILGRRKPYNRIPPAKGYNKVEIRVDMPLSYGIEPAKNRPLPPAGHIEQDVSSSAGITNTTCHDKPVLFSWFSCFSMFITSGFWSDLFWSFGKRRENENARNSQGITGSLPLPDDIMGEEDVAIRVDAVINNDKETKVAEEQINKGGVLFAENNSILWIDELVEESDEEIVNDWSEYGKAVEEEIYDAFCPYCYSCITTRILLRRRQEEENGKQNVSDMVDESDEDVIKLEYERAVEKVHTHN